MAKFSIVIPHKNSSHLLFRLLSTIPSSKDYEVIVIDDNSDELHKQNLLEYNFGSNTRMIFQDESGGAGKARNKAFNSISGKWVLFADADDWFSDNIDGLLQAEYNSKDDIIYFATDSKYNDTHEKAYRHEHFLALIDKHLQNNDDEIRYKYTSPCSKLIRFSLISENNISFEEILAGNDIMFSIKTGHYASSISVRSDVLYIISVSKGSLVNSFTKKHFDSRLGATLRANKFMRSVGKSKYQLSVLYFLLKSYSFGFSYFLFVLKSLVSYRSNIFIGSKKLFQWKKVLREREDKAYLSKKKLE